MLFNYFKSALGKENGSLDVKIREIRMFNQIENTTIRFGSKNPKLFMLLLKTSAHIISTFNFILNSCD